ncbi:MAG: electron transfer flavoprotein subunit alpha/FixB family protein [Candidatus Glassbacteria bacterium]
MTQDILVFCEQRDGQFRTIAFECLSAGRKLSAQTGGQCVALVAGPPGGAPAGVLAHHGAQKIISVEDEALTSYAPELLIQVLEAATGMIEPAVVVFGATAMGKDLAPRFSAKLGAGCASDCTDLGWEDGKLLVRRPVYAGKAILNFRMNSRPSIASIRPKAFTAQEPDEGQSCEVSPLEISFNTDNAKYTVKELKKAAGATVDVTEADIIVSGGRGMKAAENFNLIEELAEAAGGVVGASRAAVDAGWRPHSEQVGQTGKVVSPTLYIACGISGAIQHIAGMRSSKVIVAINKDPEAPIFKLADYGIVGDLFEVLPVMTAKIKEMKKAD